MEALKKDILPVPQQQSVQQAHTALRCLMIKMQPQVNPGKNGQKKRSVNCAYGS